MELKTQIAVIGAGHAGVEAALAYTMCDCTFIPCTYRGEAKPIGNFVSIADSLF